MEILAKTFNDNSMKSRENVMISFRAHVSLHLPGSAGPLGYMFCWCFFLIIVKNLTV